MRCLLKQHLFDALRRSHIYKVEIACIAVPSESTINILMCSWASGSLVIPLAESMQMRSLVLRKQLICKGDHRYLTRESDII
jgi:hypothetical protein